jgi:hypothetical protein
VARFQRKRQVLISGLSESGRAAKSHSPRTPFLRHWLGPSLEINLTENMSPVLRRSTLMALLVLVAPFSFALAQGQQPCVRVTAAARTEPRSKPLDKQHALVRGPWSSATISLFNTWGALDNNPGRSICILSPDGKEIVDIREGRVSISIGGKVHPTGFGDLTNPELDWASDSSRLFVTWTDGGEEGTWHTDVFDVTAGGLIQLNGLLDRARMDFEKRVRELPMDPLLNDNEHDRSVWEEAAYCEPYNVVGSQWLRGSKELLVSVLVPNTSACRYMTAFNVYRVAVPTGDILERYTAAEAHKKFDPATLPRIVH